jgi:hypothetical protein
MAMPGVAVLELVKVAELAAEVEHPVGRFEDLEHRLTTAEMGVLAIAREDP